MPYCWFHAFNRDSVQDTISVLRNGPAINPSPTCTTRKNEARLAIQPSCVYAYLGHPLQEFGDVVLSLPADALEGKVSPFDTGGLVEHIAPINGWSDDQRREFLARFSWPADELPELLKRYPRTLPPHRRAYLDASRPHVAGPHLLWPERNGAVTTIWAEKSNERRAWLWEGRTDHQLRVSGNLVYWSCSSPLYGQIREEAEDAAAADVDWYEELLSKYVKGGVSALVRDLRSTQEAA